MIFKILIIGGGLYMLYRMFFQPAQLGNREINDQNITEEGEYEEVD